MPELVVITEQLLAPVPGGTGRYTRSLAAALARTAPEGWSVGGVVSRHADPAAARIDGVAGPRVLGLPHRALLAGWRYRVPGFSPWPGGNTVHAPTPFAPPRAPDNRGLVVTVHDTVPWSHPETLTARGARWHRHVISRAVREATALVVPTQAVAAQLRERLDVRVPVHVIGHGATPEVSARSDGSQWPADVAARFALPERYLLAVGTLEPRKGLDVLIAALAMPAAPDLPLMIVGPGGWGGVDPASIAASHNLPPWRVRVLGAVSDAELGVLLRGASALVAPSLAEGFGLPVLEAMAAGIPVVHSDAPALVEVAGGAGLTVPRRDVPALAHALRRVIDDTTATATRIAEGRRRAVTCTWDATARATWRVHLEHDAR